MDKQILTAPVNSADLVPLESAQSTYSIDARTAIETARIKKVDIYVSAPRWENFAAKGVISLDAHNLLELASQGETTIYGPELDYYPCTAQTKVVKVQDLYIYRSHIEDLKTSSACYSNKSKMLKSDEEDTRASQRHKHQAQIFAQAIWSWDDTATIAAIIEWPAFVNVACDGVSYTANTKRKWINHLCPNRSAGRRAVNKSQKEEVSVLTRHGP